MGEMAGEEIAAAFAAADAALAAIERVVDAQEKLEAAGGLRDGLRERSDRAARIQHGEALRIYKEESLSLAKLADRVGISKARADQLVKAEERRQKEEADNA